MFPRLWAASGVAYPALVDRLIRSALAQAPRSALSRPVPAAAAQGDWAVSAGSAAPIDRAEVDQHVRRRLVVARHRHLDVGHPTRPS